MTLTGSHINFEALREVKPEIIIIDESAEIIESDLAHLQAFYPKHIIQVGDHFQLRPIVQNIFLQETYQYGFSQFQRLLQLNFPHTILEIQRRMTCHLADFVRIFYPSNSYKDTQQAQTDRFILSDASQKDVIFIPHTYQEVKHKNFPFAINLFEAYMCVKLAQRAIVEYNIKPSKISLISMYKGQKYLIQEILKTNKDDLLTQDIKVYTVDSFQGKENDVIILSCVRSNELNYIGFLREMNRVNVAFSRARKAAYYVGNFMQFSQNNNIYNNMKWKQIFDLAQFKNFIKIERCQYLKQIVQDFEQSYYKDNKIHLKPKKCMFCVARSHIGFCTDKKLIKKQPISNDFPLQDERIQFFSGIFQQQKQQLENPYWDHDIIQERR